MILDGELVAFDEHGKPSFQRMQGRTGMNPERGSGPPQLDIPVVFVIFDLLYYRDRLLLNVPYVERRGELDALKLQSDYWQTTPYSVGHGAELFEASKLHGMEGVIAKRLRSVYQPGKRSRDWLKIKVRHRQEFVVGGWVPGEGKRNGRLGALVLGYYDGDRLIYAGRVGTGFTEAVLDSLTARLLALEQETSPFSSPIPVKANFVRPELVGEVAFLEWTDAGELRHPSFQGLRLDKNPRDVGRELAIHDPV